MQTAIAQSLVRFHVSLNVSDLARSVDFYRKVFGVSPIKVRPDYAKFESENPPLVLSLEPAGAVGTGGALNHIGFRLETADELVDLQRRLEMAGLSSKREHGVECCYSRQTKFWLNDPDRTLWEFYVLEDDTADDDGPPHRHAAEARRSVVAARQSATDPPVANRESPLATPSADTPCADWEHRLDTRFPIPLPFEDRSLHEVRLRGTFNVPVDKTTRESMFAEILRVLAHNGRVVLHQLTADRPFFDGVPALPGPAAAVTEVPVDRDVLAWVEDAGFEQVRLVKFGRSPAFEIDGVAMREMIIEAHKPVDDHQRAEDQADEVTLVYKGPFRDLVDDSGRVFRRGERTRLSAAAWRTIQAGPLEEYFVCLKEQQCSVGTPTQDSLESDLCAAKLKALSDPIRLRIIDALRAGPQNVGVLAETLETEIATISHHLGILHAARLVERQKRGRFKVYRLRAGILATSASRSAKEHIDLGCCRLEIPNADR